MVQFKWGEVREYQYKIGDKVSWGRRERPGEADSVVWIGGCATTGDYEVRHINGQDYDVPLLAYFCIKFDNDTIVGFKRISEQDYDVMRKARR